MIELFETPITPAYWLPGKEVHQIRLDDARRTGNVHRGFQDSPHGTKLKLECPRVYLGEDTIGSPFELGVGVVDTCVVICGKGCPTGPRVGFYVIGHKLTT